MKFGIDCAPARENEPMNTIRLHVVLVAAAAVLSPITGHADNYICDQQFALCTSAPCIPQPGNPKVAICTCDVEEGPKLATVPCDTLKPSTDANGVRTIFSTYSPSSFSKANRC
jgi:hypothetical protein